MMDTTALAALKGQLAASSYPPLLVAHLWSWMAEELQSTLQLEGWCADCQSDPDAIGTLAQIVLLGDPERIRMALLASPWSETGVAIPSEAEEWIDYWTLKLACLADIDTGDEPEGSLSPAESAHTGTEFCACQECSECAKHTDHLRDGGRDGRSDTRSSLFLRQPAW